ncbi:MAG TPA: hypothetical protein VNJ11_05750 [Bryobacteraceae bacterium]|nr:hypothetical protein [Bryobacteraceae bacterium]
MARWSSPTRPPEGWKALLSGLIRGLHGYGILADGDRNVDAPEHQRRLRWGEASDDDETAED